MIIDLESRGLAKESILEGRAINLMSLDKNLLLRGRCPGRFSLQLCFVPSA